MFKRNKRTEEINYGTALWRDQVRFQKFFQRGGGSEPQTSKLRSKKSIKDKEGKLELRHTVMELLLHNVICISLFC